MSLAGVIATNVSVHRTISFIQEKEANDFAIKHCSPEELKQGISFFEGIKAIRGKGPDLNKVLSMVLHPSEEARIINIRKAMGQGQERKLLSQWDECFLTI